VGVFWTGWVKEVDHVDGALSRAYARCSPLETERIPVVEALTNASAWRAALLKFRGLGGVRGDAIQRLTLPPNLTRDGPRACPTSKRMR